jgi:undecaprenyl pyrophosphate phosphatase UppP
MPRLILLILLLTVVYSWEELQYVVVAIWFKISKQNKIYPKNSELDILVSDIVVIATIPLSLAYLLIASGNLVTKLLVILVEFLLLSLALKGIEEYSKRRRFTRDYQGTDKIIAVIYSLTGLISPSMRYAGSASRTASRVGIYLWALAIPLISGLGLTITVHKLGMAEFVDRLDSLIAIAVLGLVLNITIEILEKIFKSNRLHMTSLMRVILGILIIFVLTRA